MRCALILLSLAGYEFLMQNYTEGDRICLFGFSRGAYTARWYVLDLCVILRFVVLLSSSVLSPLSPH
jgi:uncharacterized protein (DUF2235 family)